MSGAYHLTQLIEEFGQDVEDVNPQLVEQSLAFLLKMIGERETEDYPLTTREALPTVLANPSPPPSGWYKIEVRE